MRKASTFLTDAQRNSVELAIADAEQQTAAEIMVVIATRSGRYDRAEDTFGLLLALVAVAAAWILFQELGPAGDWTTTQTMTLGLVPLLGMFVLWAIAGAALATRFPALARPFIPTSQIDAEVRRRGVEAFHQCRIGRTTNRTGLMIFVSLLEHTAWVAGDDAISAQLPDSTWTQACDAVVEGIKGGRADEGLIKAIKLCGAAVAEKFPRQSGDVDELVNSVVVLD